MSYTKQEVLKESAAAVAAFKKGGKPDNKGMLVAGFIIQGTVDTAGIAKAAKTTVAVVYWYRNYLRSLGIVLPGGKAKAEKKEAKKAVKKAAKKKPAKKKAAPKKPAAEAAAAL
jgi:hypothetical protein